MLLAEDIAGQTGGTVDPTQRETIAVVAWVRGGTVVLVVVLAASKSVADVGSLIFGLVYYST